MLRPLPQLLHGRPCPRLPLAPPFGVGLVAPPGSIRLPRPPLGVGPAALLVAPLRGRPGSRSTGATAPGVGVSLGDIRAAIGAAPGGPGRGPKGGLVGSRLSPVPVGRPRAGQLARTVVGILGIPIALPGIALLPALGIGHGSPVRLSRGRPSSTSVVGVLSVPRPLRLAQLLSPNWIGSPRRVQRRGLPESPTSVVGILPVPPSLQVPIHLQFARPRTGLTALPVVVAVADVGPAAPAAPWRPRSGSSGCRGSHVLRRTLWVTPSPRTGAAVAGHAGRTAGAPASGRSRRGPW